MPLRILNLEKVKLSKREEDVLTDIMSNAPKLSDALRNEELFDVETVLKALALELRTKRRPGTVSKLAGRFKTLMSREIDREIYGG